MRIGGRLSLGSHLGQWDESELSVWTTVKCLIYFNQLRGTPLEQTDI